VQTHQGTARDALAPVVGRGVGPEAMAPAQANPGTPCGPLRSQHKAPGTVAVDHADTAGWGEGNLFVGAAHADEADMAGVVGSCGVHDLCTPAGRTLCKGEVGVKHEGG
jgi:hypothetical protein